MFVFYIPGQNTCEPFQTFGQASKHIEVTGKLLATVSEPVQMQAAHTCRYVSHTQRPFKFILKLVSCTVLMVSVLVPSCTVLSILGVTILLCKRTYGTFSPYPKSETSHYRAQTQEALPKSVGMVGLPLKLNMIYML